MNFTASPTTDIFNFTTNASDLVNSTACQERFEPVYIDGVIDCNLSYAKFMKDNRLIFDTGQLIRVVGTFMIFLLSCAGNFTVLACVTVWRRSNQMSHTQLIIFHLCLANLCFTFLILPMDAVWNYTMEWYGGDAMCRITNMFKQFGMYISSAVIVVMGVDKALGLLSPCSPNQQTKRIKVLLLVAWTFSTANAIPAGIIFSVKDSHRIFNCDCEEFYIVQCVDMHVVGRLGLTVFFYYTMAISFFIPMLAIIVCYVIIMAAIAKMAKRAKVTEKQSAGFRPKTNRKSLARQSLDRARKMWQVVTALITLSFLICWGPYYFVGVLFRLNQIAIDPRATMFMLMSQYLHPCFQPIIMVALMPDVRENLRCSGLLHSNDVRTALTSKKATGHTLLLASRTSPRVVARHEHKMRSPDLATRRDDVYESPAVVCRRDQIPKI
uniref:GnRHR4 gonadotropin-releasing hormone receptor n=1 Tax=Phallusia mammillata TaxID=59560 RepID=A0A6F9DE18_9ASCI|nr:GnRHR4 gonadotropin-releasing hormone receptor [Phallusia mammillata]